MTTFMNAALPAVTSLVSTTTAVELPAGLTEIDAVRIRAAISAARTESTRIVYAQASEPVGTLVRYPRHHRLAG